MAPGKSVFQIEFGTHLCFKIIPSRYVLNEGGDEACVALTFLFKVVGWGVEDGIDYWLAENQWSSGWGVNGYAKVGIPYPDESLFLR